MKTVLGLMVVGVLCAGCATATVMVELSGGTSVAPSRLAGGQEDAQGLVYVVDGDVAALEMEHVETSTAPDGGLRIAGTLRPVSMPESAPASVNVRVLGAGDQSLGGYSTLTTETSGGWTFTVETDIQVDDVAGYVVSWVMVE